ncbi:MAG: tryptophan synthase subunit alpha [Pseudomonadota bacterium]|nr:tryptophan synthase subunit alpha [Pseudomonadota bacterium]
MSRILSCFAELKKSQRTALIPFVTAGDSEPALTVPLMHALVESGADLIELGIPFSDPMADGPVIQKAAERALKHNVSLRDVLQMVAEFRQRDATTPVLLMGYLNPVEVMGYEAFASEAGEAGVDGILLVDLPPEEGGEILPLLYAHQIDPVFLIAPTSDRGRIQKICDASRGYVYYVSLKGITGAGHLDLDSVAEQVSKIREITQLPIGVGFGIKDAATAAAMGKLADAVIVGSAIVQRIAEHQGDAEGTIKAVSSFVSELRQGLDR